jgi:hypothetical protein
LLLFNKRRIVYNSLFIKQEKNCLRDSFFDSYRFRRYIILSAEPENKIIFMRIRFLLINSSTAAIISFYIVYKKKKFLSEKTNFLLTIKLLLWFAANVVWSYYEVVLDVVSPVSSLADIFLLWAYGFLIYRLVIVYIKL